MYKSFVLPTIFIALFVMLIALLIWVYVFSRPVYVPVVPKKAVIKYVVVTATPVVSKGPSLAPKAVVKPSLSPVK